MQTPRTGTTIPTSFPITMSMSRTGDARSGMIGPVMLVAAGTVAVFYVLGIFVYGPARIGRALPPEMLYAILVIAFLYLVTAGSWVLIVAARVRTSRASQQLAGLLIALSAGAFAGLGIAASRIADGWALVVLGAALVALDVVALEIARRVWQRGEVIGRL